MKIVEHYDEKYYASQFEGSRIGSLINKSIFQEFITPGDDVLDFGCGGGFLLQNLKCKNKIGVEINPAARESAARYADDVLENLDQVADETVDVVISNHALEHTSDPVGVMAGLRSKLKIGGTLVVVVPCDPPGFRWLKDDRDMHLFSWSVNNIANLAKVAGLEVLRSEQIPLRWPPKMNLIHRYFGERGLLLAARVAHMRPSGRYQVRVVAKRKT